MIPDFFCEVFMNTHPLPQRFSVALCTLLSAAVLSVPILFFLFPAPDYSEAENRMLATAPALSAEAVFSGQYTDGLSAYFRDRLPLRAPLLTLKAAAEYATLRQENNHILSVRGGYLVKRFCYTDQQLDNFRSNAAAAQSLAHVLGSSGKPSVFVCTPRAIDVLADRCPKGALESPERSVWSAMSQAAPDAVPLTESLRARAAAGEAVWFKTDHHWTALGAYYAYAALGDTLGYCPRPKESFTMQTVCTDFWGTSHAACSAPLCRPDTVTAFRFLGDERMICIDRSTGEIRQGLYREEALRSKDKYPYFLGPNTAHLSVCLDPLHPRPTLLLIKDSYAQSLVPFLVAHFDIELLDLRYFRTDATETVRSILSSPHYAGALILLNADTLTADAGLSHITPSLLL